MAFLLALLTLSAVFFLAFSQLRYDWNWAAVYNYRTKFIQGWWTTIGLSAASLVLSTGIGITVALIQRQPVLFLRYLARIYIELIRGTPLLVQILIFYYVVADWMGLQNRYMAGVLTLSIFSGAYIAEMIRSGIEGIAKSQWESARAIGLTPGQTYRYVIVPQALRQLLPPLSGQFVSLVKDSSLLSIIAISEFTLNAQEVNANTYSAFESFLPLAIGYLILTLPISLWSQHLERRLHYDH